MITTTTVSNQCSTIENDNFNSNKNDGWLVVFYGISTQVGYSMSIPVYICIYMYGFFV